ncbi:hypothetical protein B4U79_16338 [Dinothrombium tinctorium]|uniref:Uncharacterized protein n=1 Tax=Dinothrombium tinctorium TaxID=1965070 RepID=A0A443QP57_9ACAR|nr:hypothetical protein B4U79_16379 [Dinothrombium tinctorium]RWS05233.1 hypothetical protein B4U79_16338 [Dinothrombium tinctorium]
MWRLFSLCSSLLVFVLLFARNVVCGNLSVCKTKECFPDAVVPAFEDQTADAYVFKGVRVLKVRLIHNNQLSYADFGIGELFNNLPAKLKVDAAFVDTKHYYLVSNRTYFKYSLVNKRFDGKGSLDDFNITQTYVKNALEIGHQDSVLMQTSNDRYVVCKFGERPQCEQRNYSLNDNEKSLSFVAIAKLRNNKILRYDVDRTTLYASANVTLSSDGTFSLKFGQLLNSFCDERRFCKGYGLVPVYLSPNETEYISTKNAQTALWSVVFVVIFIILVTLVTGLALEHYKETRRVIFTRRVFRRKTSDRQPFIIT